MSVIVCPMTSESLSLFEVNWLLIAYIGTFWTFYLFVRKSCWLWLSCLYHRPYMGHSLAIQSKFHQCFTVSLIYLTFLYHNEGTFRNFTWLFKNRHINRPENQSKRIIQWGQLCQNVKYDWFFWGKIYILRWHSWSKKNKLTTYNFSLELVYVSHTIGNRNGTFLMHEVMINRPDSSV